MFERRQIFNIVFDDDGTRTIYKVHLSINPDDEKSFVEKVVQWHFVQLKLRHFLLLSSSLTIYRQEQFD